MNPADMEPQLPAELQSLEATLATLVPRGDRLDAELVLFRAGQLSARSQRRWLPTVLAAFSGVAATLLVTFLVPSEPRIVERVRIVHLPAAEPQENQVSQPPMVPPSQKPWLEPFPLPGSRAAELERIDRMLQAGADPWPRATGVAAGDLSEPSRPMSYWEQLEVLLESQPGRSPGKPSKKPLNTGANS